MQKARMGSIMRAFPLLRLKRSQSAIPFLEEGSDAACRIVYVGATDNHVSTN